MKKPKLSLRLMTLAGNEDLVLDVLNDQRVEVSSGVTISSKAIEITDLEWILNQKIKAASQFNDLTLSLFCISFQNASETAPCTRLCFLNIDLEVCLTKTTNQERNFRDDVIFRLFMMHQQNPFESEFIENLNQNAFLKVMDQLQILEKAQMFVHFTVDLRSSFAEKWLFAGYRIRNCLHKHVIEYPQALWIQIELLKSSLHHLTQAERDCHHRCGVLKDQLGRIHDRIREASDFVAEVENHEAESLPLFDSTMQTLTSWIQLKNEQSYNLQMIQNEASEMHSKLRTLEKENAEMKEKLEDFIIRAKASEKMDCYQNEALEKLKNELDSALKEQETKNTLIQSLTVKFQFFEMLS